MDTQAEQSLPATKPSIDELRVQFENYKLRCEQQNKLEESKLQTFCLDDEMQQLHEDLLLLRQGLEQLQLQNSNPDAIEQCPLSSNGIEQSQPQSQQEDKPLIISTGESQCLFEHCRRRVDSQLLLLHYISDHSSGAEGFQSCYSVAEGERVVLTFNAQSCAYQTNKVIGLLAYSGSLLQLQMRPKRRHVYNSFLPQQHAHLEDHVPVVVLICRTSACAGLKDKQLAARVLKRAQPENEVYVIWLVTPQQRLQLNATLSICGRDAAKRCSSIVAVRQVRHSQNTCRFMPVDANYWRLSFGEMQKISNNFRDDLHLEIALTELEERLF
ncbi:CG12923 [Drosophila busckii]|uniref:CG12923 n=1 Tax=Drosophila busckii TaxID=30019 RepID=A0A0M4EU44_DROBS|nr:uncharacterized protein LOC108596729 [Drosophila busckii]ALC40870.1 CG12923 [Drosophila busckii]